jgi:hypothetical protein
VVRPEVWPAGRQRTDQMGTKRHKPEEIVAQLRQVDVLVSQGRSVAEAIRSIGVTEVSTGRTPGRRDLLHPEGGADRDRELETSLHLSPAACLAGRQAAGPRAVRACLRRLAGCAHPTSSAGQATQSAKADRALRVRQGIGESGSRGGGWDSRWWSDPVSCWDDRSCRHLRAFRFALAASG